MIYTRSLRNMAELSSKMSVLVILSPTYRDYLSGVVKNRLWVEMYVK